MSTTAPGQPSSRSALIVPFNRPSVTDGDLSYVMDAARRGDLAGGGADAELCASWLARRTGAGQAFMTPSCTDALEMAALVAGIEVGDEVAMPSWTFVSTANAIALRGAMPVWVDVRPDTLNLDPAALEAAIGPRTKAVVVVHYAAVGADMDAILAIAQRHGLLVIEDAAHGILASSHGQPLGSIAPLGCLSFDEQKNVTCGEGGALLVNDPELAGAAETTAHKGTSRAPFLRGEVDEYTWVGAGSSWGLAGLAAAFLRGQLERADGIVERRLDVWNAYHAALEPLESDGLCRRPVVPSDRSHNAHIYWLLLPDRSRRDEFIARMKSAGISTPFHYVPLHSSPAGRRLGRASGELPVTTHAGDTLVRLPLFADISDEQVEHVIHTARTTLPALKRDR